MRRLGNWLAVAAAAAVALVAVVDAVGPAPRAATPRTAEEPAATAPQPFRPAFTDERREAVAALGANGRLVFADPACRLHALRLPELAVESLGPGLGCTAFVPPGRLGLRNGELAWFAVGDGHTTVLTRAELGRMIRTQIAARTVRETAHPIYAFRRVAWLGGRRFAALVADTRLGEEVLVVVEGRRVLRVVPGLGEPFRFLRASPRGGYVGLIRARGRLLVFDREGRAVPLPTLPPVRSAAWSPDERLLAVATEDDVLLLPLRPAAQPVPLRLAAVDLGWRP